MGSFRRYFGEASLDANFDLFPAFRVHMAFTYITVD